MSFYTTYRKHEPVDHPGGGELVTKQDQAALCDINNILANYQRTGLITHLNGREPLYIDAPRVEGLQEALELVREAENAFMQLPAKVREEFGNDALALLSAIEDPSQHGRLEELGVFERIDTTLRAPGADRSPGQAAPGADTSPDQARSSS
jgi:phage internal scaffolding protein